jgi:positive regulator of sigma E activity
METVEEHGVVTEVSSSGGTVVIEHVRTEACGHCNLCEPQGNGTFRLPVVSDQPLHAGDRVVVGIEQPTAAVLIGLVFLIPTIALVVGLLVGGSVAADWANRSTAQAFQVGLGLGCAALAFVAVIVYDRVLRARRTISPPKILRVLEAGPPTGEKPDAGE